MPSLDIPAALINPEALIQERDRRVREAANLSRMELLEKNPVAFAQSCIRWPEGQCLTPYQAEILQEVAEFGRVSVRGLHALGKTTIAAILILWFANTRDGRDWKIITTAGAWRQLTKFLWPEVHKWIRKLNWDVLGREPYNPRTELFLTSLKLKTGEAFAVASDEPSLIEGAHADHVMYLFDESKSIPSPMFDAAEGAMSGAGEVKVVAISTPGEPAGRFYDIHARKPGFDDWKVRHVTVGEAIAAGRVTQTWVDQRRQQWGEESALFQNRVMGEFATSGEENVIPLKWVEAAIQRWEVWHERCVADGETLFTSLTTVGVDVGGEGKAETVQALLDGLTIAELRITTKEDTMQTAGRVATLLRRYGAVGIIDSNGIGGWSKKQIARARISRTRV